MKVLHLGSNEKKTQKKVWTKLEQGFQKGSRKWIVWR